MSYFYRRREYFKKHMPGGHDHDQKSHGNWANNGGGGGKGGGAWEHTHKVDVEIEGGIYGKQYQSYDEGVAAARARVREITVDHITKTNSSIEHLIVVSDDGKVLHETEGDINHVGMSSTFMKALYDEGTVTGVTLVHSHPCNTEGGEDLTAPGHPLSQTDIANFIASHGVMQAAEAVGHDGTVFRVEWLPSKEAEALAAEATAYSKAIGALAEPFAQYVITPLHSSGFITADEAWVLHQRLTGVLMGKMTGFEYKVVNPSESYQAMTRKVDAAMLEVINLQQEASGAKDSEPLPEWLGNVRTFDQAAEAFTHDQFLPHLLRQIVPDEMKRKWSAFWVSEGFQHE